MDEKVCPVCKKKVDKKIADICSSAYDYIIARIKEQHPDWQEKDGACPKCIDYYKKL